MKTGRKSRVKLLALGVSRTTLKGILEIERLANMSIEHSKKLSKKRNFTYFRVCFRVEVVTLRERYWCSNIGLKMERTSKWKLLQLHRPRTVTLFTSGFDHWSRVDLYRGHFSCLFLHNRTHPLSLTRKHNVVYNFDQKRTHKEYLKTKKIGL